MSIDHRAEAIAIAEQIRAEADDLAWHLEEMGEDEGPAEEIGDDAAHLLFRLKEVP